VLQRHQLLGRPVPAREPNWPTAGQYSLPARHDSAAVKSFVSITRRTRHLDIDGPGRRRVPDRHYEYAVVSIRQPTARPASCDSALVITPANNPSY